MNRNFNQIYEKIYKNTSQELTKLRKTRNISLTIFIILATITFVFLEKIYKNNILIILAVFSVFASLIYFIIMSNRYKKMYKAKIIETLVNSYNSNISFNAYIGVTRAEYNSARYNEIYNKFYSEDLIQGYISEKMHLKMSQVKIINEEYERNSNGNLEKKQETVFSGLFGIVNFKDYLIPELELTSNKLLSKFNSDRIEVDSAIFEKKYDLYAYDKVRTMEIFTSDLVEKINKFKDDTGNIIEIKILRNELFFRIPCGEAFEAPLIKSEMDYNTLYKYFKMIDSPIDIISKIIENAEETVK